MESNKTLTIIIDMQNDFVTGSLANPAAQAIVKPMVQFIKESEARGEVVVFTQDTHQQGYMASREGKFLPIPHCIQGTEGHKVAKALLEASRFGFTVNKPSFGMTQERWKEVIYEHFYYGLADIKRINIVGTCTDICVISNALILKSLLPEVEIYVYEDLCAGTTPENHEAALQVMRMCQINVEKYFK
jgi:nicotinamidase-related amidase